MEEIRPIVLSIAGYDPSGGAGLLADIKTFEQNNVYGIGICTAITLQTESEFLSLKWEDESAIIRGLVKMLLHYTIDIVKIGLVENMLMLQKILNTIKRIKEDIIIILDPVMRSTSGYNFWDPIVNANKLESVLSLVYLITPNYDEIQALMPGLNPIQGAKKLSLYCNVLLKGGHNETEKGIDHLFYNNEISILNPGKGQYYPKHGSGCVLSSAIASNLALGFNLKKSCERSKQYIEKFLSGNQSLLGYHHV